MKINGFVVRRSTQISAKDIVESKDAVIKFNKMINEGSRLLCKAILDTKKLHGPLTLQKQREAIEYAYNVRICHVE